MYCKIGVVILNYNSYKDTIELVHALQKQTLAEELYIVVVDNASPNNSYENLLTLEKEYESVSVIKTDENLGYAKGNNIGLEYLEKNIKPEYVAILNNDIELPENCIEKLVDRYQILEKPAVIAPKQLDINGVEQRPYSMNTFMDDCLNMFYIFKVFHKRKAMKFADSTGHNAMKVDMISGSFMFTAFSTFKKMGFFYPGTFLFVEERFVTMAARKLGLSNYILTDLSYVHAHSKTINTLFSKISKFKLLYDGWIIFTRKHRSYGNIKAMILKVLAFFSIAEMYLVEFFRNIFSNR